MIISKQNNFVKMYEAMYPGSLPKSICPLFWKVIIGLMITLSSPIMLGYGIIQKSRGKDFYWFDKYSDFGIWSSFLIDKFILVVWIVLAFAVSSKTRGIMWYDFILGPVEFVIVALLLFMLLYWADHLYNKLVEPKNYMEPKEQSVFVEGIKSWWNKICPLIEYKD